MIVRAGARGDRRASAAVEFAVVMPIFALLIMASLELGRIVMIREMLSNAARKGCRTGIQRDKGNTNITTDAKDVMTDNTITASDVTVTVTVTSPTGATLTDALGAPSGSTISTQVKVKASAVTWTPLYFKFFGKDTYDSEVVVMMKQ